MDNDLKVIIQNGDIISGEIVLHMDCGKVRKIILDDLNPGAGCVIHPDGRFVFTGKAFQTIVLDKESDSDKGVN